MNNNFWLNKKERKYFKWCKSNLGKFEGDCRRGKGGNAGVVL